MLSMIELADFVYEHKGENASPLVCELRKRASQMSEDDLNNPAALQQKLLNGIHAFEARPIHHRLKNFKP